MPKKGANKSNHRHADTRSPVKGKGGGGHGLSANQQDALRSLATRETKRIVKKDEERLLRKLTKRMTDGKNKKRSDKDSDDSSDDSSSNSSTDYDASPVKSKSKRTRRNKSKLAKAMEQNALLTIQATEYKLLVAKSEAALKEPEGGSGTQAEPVLTMTQWKELYSEAKSESVPNTPAKKIQPVEGILAKHISALTTSGANGITQMLDAKLSKCDEVTKISLGKKTCSRTAQNDLRKIAKACADKHYTDHADVAALVALKTKHELVTTACKPHTVITYILEMCISRHVDVLATELGL